MDEQSFERRLAFGRSSAATKWEAEACSSGKDA